MEKGWYILNYHDISWEENLFMRGIGGHFPPDIFRSHLEQLSLYGKLISVADGLKQYSSGVINETLISFWFDDGFAGVRKYAFPLLADYNVKGSVSINSKFLLRKEMFWRLKLSYLSQTDGLRLIRSKLRKYGYKTNSSVKLFVLDHFSEGIIDAIESVYRSFTKEYFREDAFRIFDDVEGIKVLLKNNWEICNHSASHYPVGEDTYIHRFKEEFEECEKALNEYFGIKTKYWVLPFDRYRSKRLFEVFNNSDDENRYLVLVGNKVNINPRCTNNVLFRIIPPKDDGKGLVKYLRKIPIRD